MIAKSIRRLVPLLALFVASGCIAGAQESEARVHSKAAKSAAVVVLVAIDGVRARDVFDEFERERWGNEVPPARLKYLPFLENHEGGVGRPKVAFRATGPNFVSLPGYIEMLSGKVSAGCRNNDCGTTTHTTLLDELSTRENDEKVAAIASWDRIERAASARRRGFVSTGNRAGHHHERLARHPSVARLLESGERMHGPGGIRKDEATASLALEYLDRVRPTFLFIGLGETDEFAHAGDYPNYYRALARADETIGKLLAEFAILRADGYETTLLVTTDHGRAANFRDHGAAFPESSESFLLSAGAHASLESTRPKRLADIADVVRSRLNAKER